MWCMCKAKLGERKQTVEVAVLASSLTQERMSSKTLALTRQQECKNWEWRIWCWKTRVGLQNPTKEQHWKESGFTKRALTTVTKLCMRWTARGDRFFFCEELEELGEEGGGLDEVVTDKEYVLQKGTTPCTHRIPEFLATQANPGARLDESRLERHCSFSVAKERISLPHARQYVPWAVDILAQSSGEHACKSACLDVKPLRRS